MSLIRKWVATDTSDGSTLTQWQADPPSTWLDDSSIEDIHIEEEVEKTDHKLKESDDYIDNDTGWSEAKKNNFYSTYPMYRIRVKEGRYSDADIHLTDAENAGDISSTHADNLREILGLL